MAKKRPGFFKNNRIPAKILSDIKYDKYDKIIRCREKALIAKMLGDTTLIKEYKEEIDNLGYWDKRAIIYSSIILSEDELKHWLKLVCSKGDIVDKSISAYIINQKKNGP